MIIDTNGFEIGDEVWIAYDTSNIALINNFEPILYGTVKEDSGFSLSVYTYDGVMEICHSVCYHTEQQCQLACDRLNGVRHD